MGLSALERGELATIMTQQEKVLWQNLLYYDQDAGKEPCMERRVMSSAATWGHAHALNLRKDSSVDVVGPALRRVQSRG